MIKPQTLFCTWGQYDSVKSNDLPKTPQITHGRQGEDPTLWTSRSKDFLFPLAAWRSYVCSRQPRSLQRLPTSGCFCGWGSSHSESGFVLWRVFWQPFFSNCVFPSLWSSRRLGWEQHKAVRPPRQRWLSEETLQQRRCRFNSECLCVFKTRGLMGSQIKLYFRNHVSELTSECSILLREPGEILWELFITGKIQCLKLGQRYVLKCHNPFGRSFQTGRTTCWEALRCNGKHLQPTQNCWGRKRKRHGVETWMRAGWRGERESRQRQAGDGFPRGWPALLTNNVDYGLMVRRNTERFYKEGDTIGAAT